MEKVLEGETTNFAKVQFQVYQVPVFRRSGGTTSVTGLAAPVRPADSGTGSVLAVVPSCCCCTARHLHEKLDPASVGAERRTRAQIEC